MLSKFRTAFSVVPCVKQTVAFSKNFIWKTSRISTFEAAEPEVGCREPTMTFLPKGIARGDNTMLKVWNTYHACSGLNAWTLFFNTTKCRRESHTSNKAEECADFRLLMLFNLFCMLGRIGICSPINIFFFTVHYKKFAFISESFWFMMAGVAILVMVGYVSSPIKLIN